MNEKFSVQEEPIVIKTDIQPMSVSTKKSTIEATIQKTNPGELEVEGEKIVDVEMSEAFSFDGDSIIAHAHLGGRELQDQHTIAAITGLRDELDIARATERVYSNSNGLGEYRKWHDGNPNGEDRSGYFVAIVPGTDEIEICDSTHDVYGISVSYSGFIGNQNSLYQKGNALAHNRSNDASYAIVGIVGAMRVRTDGKAINGDYVVPNAYGEATLSDNKYGYKVLSQGSYPSYNFVTVAITPQSDALSRLESSIGGGDLGDLLVKINGVDDKVNDVTIRLDTSESDMKDIVGELEGLQTKMTTTETIIADTQAAAEEAKNVANSAKTEALQAAKNASVSADKAADSANSALANVGDLTTDLKPILEWESEDIEGYNGALGFVTQVSDDHATLASIMSGGFDGGESLAAITQKVDSQGAVIQHLTSHIDKYTVGSYSLTYGLTYSEAISILSHEHIYVPTTAYEEVLDIDEKHQKIFTFEKPEEHLHSYKWIPFDELDPENSSTWAKQERLVYTYTTYIDGNSTSLDIQTDDLWYCTRDITDQPEGIDPLIAGSLYRWTGESWSWVASVYDNDRGRIIASVKQTESEIMSSVSALDGRTTLVEQNIGGLSQSVKDAEENISTIQQSVDTINLTIATANNNIASLQQHADETDASIAAIASGAFMQVYQEFAGTAPEPYNGKKYALPPAWDNGQFVFQRDPVEDGAYYFHSEDKTKYCHVTDNGYEIYTLGSEAIAALDQRISDTEAEIDAIADFKTDTNESIAAISAKADANESRINSLASQKISALLSVSETEIPMYGEYKYIAEPTWNSKTSRYEFDLADRSEDGVYYMADEDAQSYCKIIKVDYETTLYERYGVVGSSLAAIEQKVDDNSASIGLIVEKKENGQKVVNGSIIIDAINEAESIATIKADRIKLTTEDASSDIVKYIADKTSTLQNSIDELSGSIDTKMNYYWQAEAPYAEYYSVSANSLYDTYLGDFWYDTNNQVTKKYIKVENGANVYNYVWEDQASDNIPQEVFDKIDGKKSIYTSCPTAFCKNDLWLYEGITEENGLEESASANKEAPYKPHSDPKVYYKKNDLLVATVDSYEYSPSGWTQYNPNIVKMNSDCSIVIDDESVNITNGTMNLTRTDGNARIILEPSEGIRIQKLSVNNNEYNWENQLYADDNGDLIITGSITATAGFVGGWAITKDTLYSEDVGLYSGEALDWEEGEYQYPSLIGTYSTIRMWAGNTDPQLGNFIVLNDGSLYANAASITGTIYSDLGKIGGWTISERGLSHSGGEFYLNSDGSGRIGLMTFGNEYAWFNGDIYADNLVVGSTEIDGEMVDVGYINNSHIADNSIDPNKLYASYVDGVTQSIAAVQVYADETFATTESVSNIQKDIYDEFGNYVKTSTLNASIGTYIDSEAGTSQIISTCASIYQTKEDMVDYLTNVDLNNTVEQYIDSAAGTSKIISACSSVYQKKEDMDGYLTDVNLNSTVEQYIDSTTGTSKIISACSGTYQKISDMSEYATNSSIEQEVSEQVAKISLTTSTTTKDNQTTSTIALKNGSTTLSNVSIVGTTAAQASTIASDAINGITMTVTNGEKSSTLTLKNGSTTIASDTIQFTGNVVFASDLSTSGRTTINGANITTGTISADRIDVSNLKLEQLYVGSKVAIRGSYTNSSLYVGGYATSDAFNSVYINADKSIKFGSWSYSLQGIELTIGSSSTYLAPINVSSTTNLGTSYNQFSAIYGKKIYLDGAELSSSKIYQKSSTTRYVELDALGALIGTDSGFSLGNSGTPFGEAYFGSISYYLKIKDASIIPNTTIYGTSSSYFNLGSSSYPFTAVYAKEIYLNGTKLGSGSDMSGSTVNMGGSSSYYVVCNTSNELRPNASSSYNSFYLGTSSYYWHYAYIGSNTVSIGNTSSSKLGFFGATPVARQTLSTSYNNMDYSTATSSNYLVILNNLVGILKNKYGLIY